MADNELPVDEELEAAAAVLVRMGGQAIGQARRYLAVCTDQEITALAACEDGKQFRRIIDAISDRRNPPPAAETPAQTDLVVPADPAPLEDETPAQTDLE